MAAPESLIIAGEVIGFLSFGFTLLTWLGVYIDLIRTLQGAPNTIPLALGNLREEIRYEQVLCKHSSDRPDYFHVLPVEGARRTRQRNRQDFSRLLGNTLRTLWTQFCDIEKQFLVQGERPPTSSSPDDANDEIDEKMAAINGTSSGNRRRRHHRRRSATNNSNTRPSQTHKDSFIKSRMGWIEAGLSRDRQTYYNTDFKHRFLWWLKKDDLKNLADQVQRIQLRRVERDAYETNELVKRALKMYGRRSGDDVYTSTSDSGSDGGGGGGRPSGSDSDSGGREGPRGGGGAYASRRRHSGVPVRSRAGTRRRSRNGNGHSGAGGGLREVSEKEIVRRRATSPVHASSSSPPPPRPPQHSSRRPPSVAGSRLGRPQRGSVVYEYEIVNPGGIHVEYESPRQDQRWREGRQRSHSRPPRRDDD